MLGVRWQNYKRLSFLASVWENGIVLDNWVQCTLPLLLFFLSVVIICDSLLVVDQILNLFFVSWTLSGGSLGKRILGKKVLPLLLPLSPTSSPFDLSFSLNLALSFVSLSDLSSKIMLYDPVKY